jgi:dienelactone hydrolase
MLQSVSFRVAGTDVPGILHLPDGEAVGGAVVLQAIDADPATPHVVAACEALAGAGVGALRFAYRRDPSAPATPDSALADVGGAVRLVKAHPALRQQLAIVGFFSGALVAALAAGRDSRIRSAVLVAPPLRLGDDPRWKPVAELSRTRARVLLLRGADDSEVSAADLERYASVLTQARVTNRAVTITGADHRFAAADALTRMAEATAAWVRESL